MAKESRASAESGTSPRKRVWVPVLLSGDVELQKHRQNVEKELCRLFRGAEFYLPVHDEVLNGKRYFTVLSEGYAYVLYPGTKEFDKLYRSARGTYIEGPVPSGARRRIPVVTDAFIESMKTRSMQDFPSYIPGVGDKVTVQHETLSGMEGLVSDVDIGGRRAIVHIKLRSQEVVATVPFTNLEAVSIDEWGAVMTQPARTADNDFDFVCCF